MLFIPHWVALCDLSLRQLLELLAVRPALFSSMTVSERPCRGFTPPETL
jgi:hypothetical protein